MRLKLHDNPSPSFPFYIALRWKKFYRIEFSFSYFSLFQSLKIRATSRSLLCTFVARLQHVRLLVANIGANVHPTTHRDEHSAGEYQVRERVIWPRAGWLSNDLHARSVLEMPLFSRIKGPSGIKSGGHVWHGSHRQCDSSKRDRF